MNEVDVSLAEQLPGLWNVAMESTKSVHRRDTGYFEKSGRPWEGGGDSSGPPRSPMPIGRENVT
ncbi:hypothetical protein [Nocardia africana]